MFQQIIFSALCAVFFEKNVIKVTNLRNLRGLDDWLTIKGSRSKNKPEKLKTNFSCCTHTVALRDYAIFVQEGKHVDNLLSKEQRRSIIDHESERGKNREVVKMLTDLTETLTRNAIALCRKNFGEDGNSRQIVLLLSRHNSLVKAWLENNSMPKYHTIFLSLSVYNVKMSS